MNISLDKIAIAFTQGIPVVIQMGKVIIPSRYSDPNRLRPNMRGYGQTYAFGNY